MAKVSLLLLMVSMTVALALAHDTGNYTLNKREKRELLARSKRRWVLSTIELVEEDPGPFPKFATQMFNDRTELFKSHQFRLSGMGVTEEPLGVFSIGDNDGVVYVLKPIDRETHPFFHIMFDIIDKVTNRPVDKTLAFDVAITDINDNAPYFEHPVIEASVKESTPEGYLPVPLTARDMDQVNTQNSNISISVLSQEPAEPKINLKEVEGTKMSQLTFTGCFDYDKAKMYKVVVEARDHGIPALSSTVVVNLQITDSNTHQPVFKNKTYNAHMMEMESNKEILRVAVTDADTPNTTAWRAVYSIVKGNEEGNYKIETDPKTNEGILTVIKGKNIKEKTTLTNVQIAVANEEPLFVCSSGGAVSTAKPLTVPPQTVNVTVKVIDVNDPPMFDRKVTDVYAKEEQEEKGKVLYKPKITDVDSDVEKIRYELVDDPAGWVTIDPKTGVVTTVKKMDRESPHVNKDNIYTVLIQAIDNGEPPATATGTILVHLGDINDNTPYVVEKKLVMCGNKVIVPLADKDNPPFGCPCYLSLGADHGDKALKSRWKLDPANGMEAGLVSLKSLPYGNYTVPLVIQDQQGLVVNETVQVMVCDCEGGDKCRASLPRTSSLGLAAIGLLLAGLLLLFLLLLFLLLCECGGKTFTHLPLNLQDEGNQTLIKYNEEGGSSACKSEPMLSMTRTISNRVAVDLVDGVKQATPGKKFTQETNEMTQKTNEMHRTTGRTMVNQVSSSGGGGFSGWGTLSEANGTLRSQNGRGMQYQKWTTSRNNTMRNNSSRYSRSFSLLSDQHISEHIDRRLYMIGDEMDYQSYEYGYEGRGSNCQSLDELSLSNLGDDLKFLEDLGSKFNTLGGICHEDMQKRNIRL